MGLAVLLHLPALGVLPLSDDYIQHGMVHGLVAGDYAPWNLYALFSADPAARAGQLTAGLVPWWTAPDFHAGVLRPLPSVLLWLDHTVAPRNAVAHHVHSLVWLAALLVVTAGVLRRLFDRPIAWVALVCFAADPGLSLPVSWLANRATLVSATIGFLALWAHVAWREQSTRRPPWLVLTAMSGAFATGEYGLVVAGYVLAYEVVHRKHPRGWDAPWLHRTWPVLVPALAYLTWHVAGGFGMAGAEFYAHPFEDPAGYPRPRSAAPGTVPPMLLRHGGDSRRAWRREAVPSRARSFLGVRAGRISRLSESWGALSSGREDTGRRLSPGRGLRRRRRGCPGRRGSRS